MPDIYYYFAGLARLLPPVIFIAIVSGTAVAVAVDIGKELATDVTTGALAVMAERRGTVKVLYRDV